MNELVARLRGNAGVADCLDAADLIEAQQKRIAELERNNAVLIKSASEAADDRLILGQAMGMLTTIDPAMEIDVDYPTAMAEHLTQYVDAIKDRMMEAETALRECMAHAQDLCNDLEIMNAEPFPSVKAFRAWKEGQHE